VPQRGTRQYVCDECKAKSYHHWLERNRAARLRCPACGSARLELVTEEARREQASRNEVRLAGHRDMTRPPERPGRRVT
jgi:DNA-directed RNA polymerase subunit RPC12/RpoP